MQIIQTVLDFVTKNWILCAAVGVLVALFVVIAIISAVKTKRYRARSLAQSQELVSKLDEALCKIAALEELMQAQAERMEELSVLALLQPVQPSLQEEESVAEACEQPPVLTEEDPTDAAVGLLDTETDEDDIFAKVEALTKGQPETFDFKPVIPVYDLSKIEPSSGATSDPSNEEPNELDDILGRIDDAIAERKGKK